MSPTPFQDAPSVVQRILDHIDRKTTDRAEASWREPVENYRSPARFAAEQALLRRLPTAFCASASLPQQGSYLAREVGGMQILAVRGSDGQVRAFRNACRHRGTRLVTGSGCQQAFACRYHGWTYALDGSLRHVPHEDGFPGLDKSTRGLAPLATREANGIVFVTQEASAQAARCELDALPVRIGPEFRLLGSVEREVAANWKIFVEGFLEGYHIRTTHTRTFYPLQYDNLNVVERHGDHSRIAFPYRVVEKQRALAPAARSADGVLTYVTHLFPNSMLATFPGRIVFVVIEPLAIDRTRFVTTLLTDRDPNDADVKTSLERGKDLVDLGASEDQEMAGAIQQSLASGANEYFEFGLFEGAIGHFHRTLQRALDAAR